MRRLTPKQQQRLADARIERAVPRNREIPMLELPRLYRLGQSLVAAGATDDQLVAAFLDAVNQMGGAR